MIIQLKQTIDNLTKVYVNDVFLTYLEYKKLPNENEYFFEFVYKNTVYEIDKAFYADSHLFELIEHMKKIVEKKKFNDNEREHFLNVCDKWLFSIVRSLTLDDTILSKQSTVFTRYNYVRFNYCIGERYITSKEQYVALYYNQCKSPLLFKLDESDYHMVNKNIYHKHLTYFNLRFYQLIEELEAYNRPLPPSFICDIIEKEFLKVI